MTTINYTLVTPSSTSTAADTSPLSTETDHAGYALDKLLLMYRDKPRMRAYLTAIINLLQPVEDLAWDLITTRYLSDQSTDPVGTGAVGDQLDGLGTILGEARNDLSDAEYLTFLKIRILVNNSDGTIKPFAEILELIGTTEGEIKDVPPAHVQIKAASVAYPIRTGLFLGQAKAAGVGLTFIYYSGDFDDCFSFSDTYATETTSATKGFGSEYGDPTGGELAGVTNGV